MKKRLWLQKNITPALLLPAGLLLLLAVALLPAASVSSRGDEDENTALALRRCAHYLLKAAGDSTTRIPPVQRVDAQTWRFRLEHSFDYEKLPVLLDESFKALGVKGNYNVGVLDCIAGDLQLGYNFQDFAKTGQVPCGGRAVAEGCYDVQVHFTRADRFDSWPWKIGLFVLAIMLGLGYYASRFLRRQTLAPTTAEPEAESAALYFGQSSLQMENQILLSAGARHDLTYREAKLLQLFASNPNRLLERDYILQQVWADEGILVGRSVDVFVSRLRKLLREDASLRIATVHGVGYRLEVIV